MHWLNKAHHRNNINNILDSSNSFIPKIRWHFPMQHLSSSPGVQCRSLPPSMWALERSRNVCVSMWHERLDLSSSSGNKDVFRRVLHLLLFPKLDMWGVTEKYKVWCFSYYFPSPWTVRLRSTPCS